MNRILFDKTVSSQPETFPFVTLPEPEPTTVPSKGEYMMIYHVHNSVTCIHRLHRMQQGDIVCSARHNLYPLSVQ